LRNRLIKKLIVEFVIEFAVTLVTTAIVTLLWNIIRHRETAINWETSFRFALIFAIILIWVKSQKVPVRPG
jgi:hypothetical protein